MWVRQKLEANALKNPLPSISLWVSFRHLPGVIFIYRSSILSAISFQGNRWKSLKFLSENTNHLVYLIQATMLVQ